MPSQHTGSFTIMDYSEEKRSFSLSFGAITAVSIAGFLSQFGDLRTALGNIILGTLVGDQWVGDRTKYAETAPTDSGAQGELKFLFTYQGDTSNKKYRMEVPTPDTDKIIAGTDKVDLTDTDIAGFVTAFEALARTPDDDTETVSVIDARLVGRNN